MLGLSCHILTLWRSNLTVQTALGKEQRRVCSLKLFKYASLNTLCKILQEQHHWTTGKHTVWLHTNWGADRALLTNSVVTTSMTWYSVHSLNFLHSMSHHERTYLKVHIPSTFKSLQASLLYNVQAVTSILNSPHIGKSLNLHGLNGSEVSYWIHPSAPRSQYFSSSPVWISTPQT